MHDPAPAIDLRPARPDDALCLGVLATQVFLDTYAPAGIRAAVAREVLRACSTGAFEAVLRRTGTFVIVAEQAAHLVGFAQVAIGSGHALVETARPAELDRLYVQEPFTGRGLGSRLLDAAQRLAAERGATALWLTPYVHNLRAIGFYAKHGYVDLGTTFFEMDDERHENRVVAKALSPA